MSKCVDSKGLFCINNRCVFGAFVLQKYKNLTRRGEELKWLRRATWIEVCVAKNNLERQLPEEGTVQRTAAWTKMQREDQPNTRRLCSKNRKRSELGNSYCRYPPRLSLPSVLSPLLRHSWPTLAPGIPKTAGSNTNSVKTNTNADTLCLHWPQSLWTQLRPGPVCIRYRGFPSLCSRGNSKCKKMQQEKNQRMGVCVCSPPWVMWWGQQLVNPMTHHRAGNPSVSRLDGVNDREGVWLWASVCLLVPKRKDV